MQTQQGAKIYHRASKGYIAVMPDGSWQSSEQGQEGDIKGQGSRSLYHFLIHPSIAGSRDIKRYKRPPEWD
jgi:hypothetical protein